MSASIYYQPVNGTYLPMGGPSSFLEMLRHLTGGDYPFVFTEGSIGRLQGAQAATTDPEHAAALNTIIDAVMRHGEVRIRAEY